MTVYLLEIRPGYQHARHYLGWAPDGRLWGRMLAHMNGAGSVLTRAAVASGCTLVLVRTWPGGRAEERRLKGRPRGSEKLSERCPVCRGMTRIDQWAGGGQLIAARYARRWADRDHGLAARLALGHADPWAS